MSEPTIAPVPIHDPALVEMFEGLAQLANKGALTSGACVWLTDDGQIQTWIAGAASRRPLTGIGMTKVLEHRLMQSMYRAD